MALFHYLIICSPSAFGGCNDENTVIDSVTINGRTQLRNEIQGLRQPGKPCIFFNKKGFEVGIAGSSVDVTINARLTVTPVGNRNFSFFLCSAGHQYNGPATSADSNADGLTVLKGSYTVGNKVNEGCVAFLEKKFANAEASDSEEVAAKAMVPMQLRATSSSCKRALLSEKGTTRRIVKRIIGK